ncbi:MAG: hypothetical protein ACPKM0_00250 [Pleomorphochaeta sp.]
MLDKLKNSQAELASIFEKAIKRGTFSHSTLFCGPKYSSKMTAAIEVAKALSCTENNFGESCNCHSCNLYERYLMQNLIIVSNRDFESRIEVASQNYIKNRNEFTKDYLIKTIRVLLLSYHNGIYTDKNKKLFDNAFIVSELINEFDASKEVYKVREAQRFVKDLKTKLNPLLAISKKNLTNLSVDGVRALQVWLSNTLVNEKSRIVIIEKIEKANESVKNSLLKILEEPNNNVYFILISENPSRIMKTILSRVRKYNFSVIEEDKQLALLEPFQLEDKNINSLEKFFLSASGMKINDVESSLDLIINSFNKNKYLNSEQLSQAIIKLDSSTSDEFVLKQLINRINISYQKNLINSFKAKQIIDDISQLYNNQRIFNLPKKNMYENIYRKMMEKR